MAREATVRIVVETKQARRELDSLQRELKQTEKTSARTTKGVRAEFERMGRSISRARSAVGAFVSVLAGREFIRVADQMTLATARIELFSGSAEEAATTMEQLLSASLRSRSSVGDTMALYARFAATTEHLGLQTEQLVAFTEGLQKTFLISGATAMEARASAVQLAQALGAGALRGDEFRSVAEQNIRLLQLLGIEMDVFVGELKQLSIDGLITTENILNAIIKNMGTLNEQVEQLPITFGQAGQIGKTAFALFVNEINEATNASNAFAESMISFVGFLRENRDWVFGFFGGIATALDLVSTTFGAVYDNARAFMGLMIAIANFDGTAINSAWGELTNTTIDNFSAALERAEARYDAFQEKLGETTAETTLGVVDPVAIMEPLSQVRERMEEIMDVQERLMEGLGPSPEELEAAGKFAEERREALEELADQLEEVGEEGANAMSQLEKAGVMAAESMTDAFVDFAVTGKGSFSDMIESMLQDIARLMVRQAIVGGLNQIPFFGGSADGSVATAGGITAFAKGGVVGSPTLFQAGNGIGLMGEAGPEAIMPLQRHGGKLGVAGAAPTINIINQAGVEADVTTSPDGMNIDILLTQKMKSMIGSGALDKQMHTTYGVSRRGR